MDFSSDKQPNIPVQTPDTSHLSRSEKRSRKSNRRLVAGFAVFVIVVVVAAIGGGVYYLKTQLDKSAAEAAETAKITGNKQLTPEQQISAVLNTSVQNQQAALQQENGNAAIESATLTAEQADTTLSGTSSQLTTCSVINAFITKSKVALSTRQLQIAAAFAQSLNGIQTTWQQENQQKTTNRQAAEKTFTAQADALAATPGLSTAQKAAATDYKNVLLTGSHTFETNVDAAEAGYQQDMKSLLQAHQAALTALIQTLVSAIDTAFATAQQDCTQAGVGETLVNAITTANTSLLASGSKLDDQNIVKAAAIATKRDTTFSQQSTQYATISDQATAKLTNSIVASS